uniref:Uncharacterized protein n=1 Tax=Populus trichocarpa TaxID=3694 RepID=A0A2K1R012_POPTR
MHCEPCLAKTRGDVSMLSGLILRLAQLSTSTHQEAVDVRTVFRWLWMCDAEMWHWSALASINSGLYISRRSSLVSKW